MLKVKHIVALRFRRSCQDQPKEANEKAPPLPPPPALPLPAAPAAAELAAEAIKCFLAPHCASGQGCEVEVFKTKLRVCRQKD
uniref:Uncharacterized protein n=1 Tax=Ditylenchus dipsaci TaxID=166011 RepID=A0A915CZB4_9BILA